MEESSSREGRKRLSMDIPDEIYDEMKKRTEKRNCTITKWILAAIVQKLREEKYYE